MIDRSSKLVRTCAVAAALLILPLAGGSSRAATFTRVVIPDSGYIYEPGIDIGGDGTIFVNGPEGIGGSSRLWRSDDDGGEFYPQPISLPFGLNPGGGDGDVVIGT